MTLHSDSAGRFAFWRLALWLILLLGAFGALQYGVHAQRVWAVLASPDLDPAGRSALHTMLGWDLAYFIAAAVLVVLCAAAILRQGWSRLPLRVALALLAATLLASGALLYRQWGAWHALPHAPGMAVRLADEARRVHLSLGFDAAGALLMGWLVWQLGRDSVRAQFRRRRP
ncbi:hypothetical protein [Dyella sp.]|uniref:hypothetical protein n=1 Tax=Dyella sp. TaxID=1869338 RepID=UPI002D77D425|nr:hypothetical protein [Dyella sp.]HET6431866.1 hypothetical protein [Dyella sp.]